MTKHLSLKQVLATLFTIAALFAGQQAWAETVTYTLSGTTEQNGNVNFTATASGSVSGTITDQWDTKTTSRSITLLDGLTLNISTDRNNGLLANGSLIIFAQNNNGGNLQLTHISKYIYHITLTTRNDDIIEVWNMSKSYNFQFKEISVCSIMVEYADAIPINTAEISGINSSYTISNTAITPTPTVTWHGTTLNAGTDYTVSYQNNNTAGTATVTAAGTGIYNGSASTNYTLNWATYTVCFKKTTTTPRAR